MKTKHTLLTVFSVIIILCHSGAEAQLLAPSSLQATAISSNKINLAWVDTNKRETGYSIEQSVISTSGFMKVGTTAKNVTTYSDGGLESGVTYYYRVQAINRKESSSYSNIASAITLPQDTTPPTVSITSPSSGTTYTTAQTVTITASASDNVGVTKVEFYDGGVLKGTDTSNPYTFPWTFTSANNGTHIWTAKAYDEAGNSSVSTEVSLIVNIDTTPPPVPTGLTATAVSCSQINLSWSASTDTGGSGLKGYNVYRNSTYLKQVLAPETSTSDTGLAASTSYSYTVSAIDNAGNESAQSSSANATTPECPDATAPSVPTGLTATAVSCDQINLSWNASTDTGGSGLKGYSVYRNGAYLKQVLAPTTSDTGLAASTSYSYTVSAIDNAGNESAQSSSANATTPQCLDTTAPSVPTGLTATAVSCGQINLSWSASTDTGGSGLKGYNVYRNGTYLKQVLAPATSTSDTGLAASTSYSYTVSAIDNAGNESARGTDAVYVYELEP